MSYHRKFYSMFGKVRTLPTIQVALGFILMCIVGGTWHGMALAQRDDVNNYAKIRLQDAIEVDEGQPLSFRITGENWTGREVVIFLTATGRPANSGPNFTPPRRRLSLPPGGNINKAVSVPTTNVRRSDGVQRRSVRLQMTSQDRRVTIEDDIAIGIVKDVPEPRPTFQISDQSATEGDDITFNITMSGTARSTDEYMITTADGSAEAGKDFQAIERVILPGGRVNRAIRSRGNIALTIKTNPNGDVEGTRKFQVQLYRRRGDSRPVPEASATGTIEDDDRPPQFRIYPPAPVDEGSELSFPVRGINTSSSPIRLQISSAGSSGNSPLFFNPPIILMIEPGQRAPPVLVKTIADPAENGQRRVVLAISSPDGRARTSAGRAIGLVNDNPVSLPQPPPGSPPRFSIFDAADTEEGGILTFNITGQNSSDAAIRLTATVTNSLTEERDQSEIMTVAPGENARPVTINTRCSGNLTGSREIMVTLISTDLASEIIDGQASGTIIQSANCSDDTLPPPPPPPSPPPITPDPDPIWPIIAAIVASAAGLGGGMWLLIPKPGLDMTMRTGESEFTPAGDDIFAVPPLRTRIGKRFGQAEFPDPLPITSSSTKPPEKPA